MYSSCSLSQCLTPIMESIRQSASAKQIALYVDLPESVCVAPGVPLARILKPLADLIVQRTEPRTEIAIVATQHHGFLEIELAEGGDRRLQGGSQYQPQIPDSFSYLNVTISKASRLLARFGGQLQILPCPQGGMAWTVSIPSHSLASPGDASGEDSRDDTRSEEAS